MFKDINIIEYYKEEIKKKLNPTSLIISDFKEINEDVISEIKESSLSFSDVIVAVVSSRETKGTKRQRNEKLKESIKKLNNVRVINVSSYKVENILQKINEPITEIVNIET
jgi:phosphopantetheine adenylyltransferase